MVEMPKRAFPAKPGMPLFGALHQKTEAFRDFAAPRPNLKRWTMRFSHEVYNGQLYSAGVDSGYHS